MKDYVAAKCSVSRVVQKCVRLIFAMLRLHNTQTYWCRFFISIRLRFCLHFFLFGWHTLSYIDLFSHADIRNSKIHTRRMMYKTWITYADKSKLKWIFWNYTGNIWKTTSDVIQSIYFIDIFSWMYFSYIEIYVSKDRKIYINTSKWKNIYMIRCNF